jgi:GMP synthase (glutamine-hydrolysing)
MIKPFLILQLRPEETAADNEFEAFLTAGGLDKANVRRIRMEKQGVPRINLNNFSGIITGGGPSNISDPAYKKSASQKKFESDLKVLFDEITAKDFPFLGACYGLGALASYLGGKVSKEKYGEAVGAVDITLTEEGQKDPLLKDLPKQFKAFVGHKEAVQETPPQAILLAGSATCPFQMIKTKNNIYATQFHPELDSAGLILRIKVYKHAGYFPPDDANKLIQSVKQQTVTVPEKILKRFINRYSIAL